MAIIDCVRKPVKNDANNEIIQLFDSLKLVTGSGTGGASKVRLTDEAPRRRLRGKQPDPDRRV